MRKLLTIIMALGLLAALSACGNTIDGMGRDIEHAGQTIQGL
jgi:predicted small secreted protein